MTTVTPDLEQETRRAWSEYARALSGLDGAEYEAAEEEAWEHLQATLHSLEPEEASIADPSVG